MLAVLDRTGQGSKLTQGMAAMGFLRYAIKPDAWHQITPRRRSSAICLKRFIVSKSDFQLGSAKRTSELISDTAEMYLSSRG